MKGMDQGPDKVWRPLHDVDAPAQSPAFKRHVPIEEAAQIADSNSNPEDLLLAKEEMEEEERKELGDEG